jgi:hypothetical protein
MSIMATTPISKITITDNRCDIYTIDDDNELIYMLKNKNMCRLSLHEDPKNISGNINYTQLFEMLKMNRSIITIHFGRHDRDNYDYDEWFALLQDTLTVNNTLNIFRLVKPNLEYKDWNNIDNLTKNSSITTVTLFCVSIYSMLATDNYNSIKNMLKNNTTLLHLRLNLVWVFESCSKCLAEIFRTNKTLRSLHIYTRHIVGIPHVINALEHNYSITDFTWDPKGTFDEYRLVRTYCIRNYHNIVLKSMMLCDV